jgi:Fe-S-cluster-containing dehydrogenase component
VKRFRFDLDRCTGCHACVVACANENRLPPRGSWREVVSFNGRRHPRLAAFHLSLACNHCDRPACLEGCPAGVYSRDEETGAVVARPDRCLGCRYCSWACPYDAPRFDAAEGVMRKCDFCAARQHDGRGPACASVCPVGALEIEERGDMAHPFTPPGFPPTMLEPAIAFSMAARAAPRFAGPAPNGAVPAGAPVEPPKITFRSEWPLLVFTTIASVLAAFVLAGTRIGPLWFAGLGALALGVSSVHLGRPLRAWRAVWNWRRSWLSREIILFAAFVALAAVGLRAPAIVAALAALYAIDRLYQVALQMPRWNFHSAHTLLNALYLAGILAGFLPGAALAGAVKLALYLRRKRAKRAWLSAPRVLFGFVVPFVFQGLTGAAGAVLGDLIDRAEFYEELDVVTPKRRMRRDFEHALKRA